MMTQARRWTTRNAIAGMAIALCMAAAEVCHLVAATDDLPEPAVARYARLRLELAEANLAKVRQLNAKVANSISAAVVADYERDIEVARQRVKALGSEGESLFQGWLARARAAAAAARSDWKRADEVNRRKPNTIDAADIERFRLRYELAAALVNQGESLLMAEPIAQQAWQIEVLSSEVERLNEEVLRQDGVTRPIRLWIY